MRLRGHFEIAEGQMFSNADFIVDSRGKFSSAALPEGVFRQGPIEVDYAPGMERQQTRSSVWTMQGAVPEHHVVADGRPLVVEGYRIYPTHNKGFSAILSWRPQAGGAPVVGAVNFPSYPRLSWRQQSSWIIPDGQTLTLELMPAQIPLERNWMLSADQAGALIHIETADGARWQLREGGVLIHPGMVDEKALASKRSLNVALLGVLSTYLDIPEEIWVEAVRSSFAGKLHEVNLRAFALGRAAGQSSKEQSL